MDPLKILLVEDNAGDANLIHELVLETGIDAEVSWLKDGKEAIERIEGGLWADVVILDLNMPMVDGHQLIRFLQDIDALGRATIVVMTGSSSPSDKERVRAAGVRYYLIKPMGLKEMLETTMALKKIFVARSHGSDPFSKS
jgi:CheY-like chemotaxis protein